LEVTLRDRRATGLPWVLKQPPNCAPHRKVGPIRRNGLSSEGGISKRTAFSPPLRGAATKTISIRTNEGQRPTRQGRSARRVGRWPGALAPGGCAARASHGRGDGPGRNLHEASSRLLVGQPPGPSLFQSPDGPADPVGLVLFAEPQQVRAWA
jgi:hypothetical protein